ncbi:hypothetical protein DPEC_G00330310 [Dallia pectoralis]|uniref:Uncharacterized protein n=1 Tax=Dallia pectoralis TaxID=75939 RepID=A0ACC2F8X4_DALPE|nr:hypothetical protein DPEC_G00330310 [Dallia pectoralis]
MPNVPLTLDPPIVEACTVVISSPFDGGDQDHVSNQTNYVSWQLLMARLIFCKWIRPLTEAYGDAPSLRLDPGGSPSTRLKTTEGTSRFASPVGFDVFGKESFGPSHWGKGGATLLSCHLSL